ncbi:hypothetical protein [Methylobacterium radiotolerans]|uniref:Uncharacterized protein n=1 Tax=Methylobacterium radiotolerans (strain ATCC 27329 / DSM 1819 / JCM 2831 / NBRC 15690 / NCIMB 10815 / 0-1) TaxID=426355 RepID=B1LUG5_METRJ|nr:hypothetical protein [Methylobacterium radiotolerans]ACB23983.1 hypothetical protein Mrad2831_1988 [Methylobacterium radiotolerans JCM 2831]GEM97443.1 hypothetical protein MRA01_19830 [Methylobacterium radiotolerans]
MAYLDRMGREGVRTLSDDGEIATPDQLAERRVRIEERQRREQPIRALPAPESDIGNEAELRDRLRLAIAERTLRDADHVRAVEAAERGRELHRQAVAAVEEAAAEVSRIGDDLADRIARWAEGGGSVPHPAADDSGEAHAWHVAAQARAASAEQACMALTATATARQQAAADAGLRVQQSVYRVVTRDAEVIARRVEAMRAEADALAGGIGQIGMYFGPNAALGAPYQSATARLVGGAIIKVQAANVETAANRRMREVWGAYVAALTTDADARLELLGINPD